jgi:hypothetical protein
MLARIKRATAAVRQHPAISGAYPALHLIGLTLNHDAVFLTYIMGWGNGGFP